MKSEFEKAIDRALTEGKTLSQIKAPTSTLRPTGPPPAPKVIDSHAAVIRHTKVRETTWAERATWGICPACHAAEGEWCHSEIGYQVGMRVDGQRMKTGEGAHLARLRAAPTHVKLVPA